MGKVQMIDLIMWHMFSKKIVRARLEVKIRLLELEIFMLENEHILKKITAQPPLSGKDIPTLEDELIEVKAYLMAVKRNQPEFRKAWMKIKRDATRNNDYI
jgi:hypothetical protein